jgi:hypothetical protein
VAFWHHWDARSVEYPDRERWLAVFIASLERGLWEEVDGDLYPAVDARWEAFVRTHNPGFPRRRAAGVE